MYSSEFTLISFLGARLRKSKTNDRRYTFGTKGRREAPWRTAFRLEKFLRGDKAPQDE